MITRHHQEGDKQSVAVYSDCECYRYSLTRIWNGAGRRALFIMLNPSTATELQNDPTVERCERRARTLGFGSFTVINIFAFRATDPRKMRAAKDPVGPENDKAILQALDTADQVICAWGTHGQHLDRAHTIEQLLRARNIALFILELTAGGQPKHPLYISYQKQPQPWLSGSTQLHG